MPENIKWDAVFQSIVDTWLPLFGVIIAVIVITVVVRIIKKKHKK
ncbi:hypothetical protein [Acetatifactor aquisgranensis]|nr:hypothetical protein [Acetatifactor aquisgranensis]